MATKFTANLVGMDDLLKDLRDISLSISDIPSIKVGVPKEGAYPDGTPIETVGFVNEFGSEANNIPERSFLRSTIIDNNDKYVEMMEKGLDGVVQGKTDVDTMVNLIGITAEGDVKDKITDLKTPPNTESTIKKKKSSNPLVDTGLLRSSIIYEIGDE